MHVIGHETVAEEREIIEFRILTQQLEISGAVGVVGEDELSGIAALGNMMGKIGNGNPRQTCHEWNLSGPGARCARFRLEE